MKPSASKLLFVSLVVNLFVSVAFCKDDNYFGYRLNYSTQKLKASEISSAFPDFSNGHTSSFFFRRPVAKNLLFEVAPGAGNVEDSQAQYTYQYNTLGLIYTTGKSFVFETGGSIGAGLFAITTGDNKIGEVQSAGTILRKEAGLYTVHIALGTSIGGSVFLIDIRQIGFFDKDFSKLNGLTAGVLIYFSI